MNTRCPKCGYERKSSDQAPEWQCPSCGVAYNKVSRAAAKPAAGHSYHVVDSSPRKPSGLFVSALVLIACAVVFGGAIFGGKLFLDNRKAQQYKSDLNTLSAFQDEWNSEVKLAGQTARIAVSNRVAALQDIKRRWEAVAFTTECFVQAKPIYREAMAQTIDGFMEFMGQNETESTTLLTKSLQTQSAFLDKIIACKPAGFTP